MTLTFLRCSTLLRSARSARSARLALFRVLVLVAGFASAAAEAQEPPRIPLRDELHLTPIRLEGRDESGEDFRSATPVLMQGVRQNVPVDQDELARRLRAMYDSNETITAPFAIAPGAGQLASPPFGSQVPRVAGERLPWILPMVTVALLLALVLGRHHARRRESAG